MNQKTPMQEQIEGHVSQTSRVRPDIPFLGFDITDIVQPEIFVQYSDL